MTKRYVKEFEGWVSPEFELAKPLPQKYQGKTHVNRENDIVQLVCNDKAVSTTMKRRQSRIQIVNVASRLGISVRDIKTVTIRKGNK